MQYLYSISVSASLDIWELIIHFLDRHRRLHVLILGCYQVGLMNVRVAMKVLLALWSGDHGLGDNHL